MLKQSVSAGGMGEANVPEVRVVTENGPDGVAMWSPSLVTLKSCLRGVAGRSLIGVSSGEGEPWGFEEQEQGQPFGGFLTLKEGKRNGMGA